MKREDAPIARTIISAALDITKRTKMRSIYEGITPAPDGAVHSFLNPAGTECVAGDTYVLASGGWRQIQDLHHMMKIWDGEGFHRPMRFVKHLDRDGFEIVTAYGFRLKGSSNHPVWTRRGWVALEDLTTDDEVFVDFGRDFWGTVSPLLAWEPLKGAHTHINPPTFVTPELAELAGMWLADGSLHDGNGSYGVRLSNGCEEILQRFRTLTNEVFGIEGGMTRATTRVDSAAINSKEAVEFFKLIGLRGLACEKKIPEAFLRGNKSTVRALLRGLTLDTHILEEKHTIAFGTQSVRLQEQIHLLLTNMGILASRQRSGRVMKLVVCRSSLARFLDLVGFVQTEKAQAVGCLLNRRLPERPEFDGWVKVVKKTPWRGDVYDISMPVRHEYVANGLRVHNTSRFSHSSTWLFAPGSYNLATLPKKTAMADPLFRVRDVIVPHEGRVLMAADYSRAEARWCAYIAGDEKRIKLQESGVDEYRIFAALVMWDDESRWEDVPKKVRNSIGKVGVLSGQYQVGWRTLQSSVNDDYNLHGVTIDAKTAKKMEAIWPEGFPRTVEWWRETREDVLTRGYTINPFGRKRYYFSRLETESQRAAVVREAIADGPQSANAMALNKALRRLYEKHDPTLLRMLLQVHDEIVFDCLEEDVAKVARIVREEMETPFDVGGRTLVIPAEVSVTRTSWSEMEDVT